MLRKDALTGQYIIEKPEKYISNKTEKKSFISYIAGGYLGDFFFQLSVIQERFIKTGKKGILYITDLKQDFRFPISTVYKDTYDIVILQEYILDYQIYKNEHYDIDLSSWRQNNYLFKTNFYETYKSEYNIDLGLHRWLNNISYDKKWENTVLINTTDYRPNRDKFPFVDLQNKYKKCKFVFISIFKQHYDAFLNRNELTEEKVEYYNPSSLMDCVVAINSCQLFIGAPSSLICIAYALHHKSITVYVNESDNLLHSNMEYLNTKYDYN